MTRERIAEGLELLTLQLANGGDTRVPPDGWLPHEWDTLKGIAVGAVWTVRARFVVVGQA
jgi:hypothetical protein